MQYDLSILFFIKKIKIGKDGKAPLYCRITVNGGRAELSINEKVELDKWDAASQRVKGRSELVRTINDHLDIIESYIRIEQRLNIKSKMKQFIAFIYVIILLFLGLNIDVPTHDKNVKQTQITRQPASVNHSYFTDYNDFFIYVAKIEPSQQLVQVVLTSFKKFPFGEFHNRKIAELIRNKKISKYIFSAKNQVMRFEGPDLIHPFNYFW